jgi:hypothetical protein
MTPCPLPGHRMSIRKTTRSWTKLDGTVMTRTYGQEYCIDCNNGRDRSNRKAFIKELRGEFISVPKKSKYTTSPNGNKVTRIERAKDSNGFWFSSDLNIWQHGPNKVRWNRIYQGKKDREVLKYPWERV